METYTDKKLNKIIEKIKGRIKQAEELGDGNQQSMASIISRAKISSYYECIRIIDAEKTGSGYKG